MNTSAEAKARWLFTGFLLLVAAAVAGWLLLGTVRYSTYELRTRDSVSACSGAPVESMAGGGQGEIRATAGAPARACWSRRDIPVTTATVATITGRAASRGFTGHAGA
jgi:hypothetical protein